MNFFIPSLIKEANKMKNSLKAFLIVVLVLGIAPSLGFAAREKYGEKISNYKVTAIKDILAAPKAYEGRLVTIEGKIDSECASGCWFYLKVGQGNVTIYVDIRESGFAIPQYVGKQVLVEGSVIIDGSRVRVKGRGVEIK
jgi:hypothetical protein